MKATYEERIQDWVLKNYAHEDKNPNHAQFSAAEVAQMIINYNRQLRSGKLKGE